MTVSSRLSVVERFLLLICDHRRSLSALSATTDGSSLETLFFINIRALSPLHHACLDHFLLLVPFDQ